MKKGALVTLVMLMLVVSIHVSAADMSVNASLNIGSSSNKQPPAAAKKKKKKVSPTEVRDTVAPVITIIGKNPVSITANTTYVDAGATALDNIDGDVSNRILSANTVNTSVVGTYSVAYSVTDRAGNVNVADRTVNVVQPCSTSETVKTYSRGKWSEKVVTVDHCKKEKKEETPAAISPTTTTNTNFNDHVRIGIKLICLRDYTFSGDNRFSMQNSDSGSDLGAILELKNGWYGLEVDPVVHTFEVKGKFLGSYLGTNTVKTQSGYLKGYYVVAPKVELTFGLGIEKADIDGTWAIGGFHFASSVTQYSTKIKLGANYQAYKYLILGAAYELGGAEVTNLDPNSGPTFPDEKLKLNSLVTVGASIPLF